MGSVLSSVGRYGVCVRVYEVRVDLRDDLSEIMTQKFKAAIERGNPPSGTLKSVVSLKDNGGNRWEYVGIIPMAAGRVMMALCSTKGERQCMNFGRDEGIEAAFTTEDV